MGGRYYFQITALPSLGQLGSAPPMTPMELIDHLGDDPAPAELVKAIFLGDDLLQRDSYLSGEAQEVSPVVLSPAQATNEGPLPDELSPGETHHHVPGDAVWDAYYRYVRSVGDKTNSEFLNGWVGYEVSLRNVLAEARAKVLGLEPSHYIVASDLATSGEKFDSIIGEWSAAKNPLEALRIIDRARWDWLARNDKWFTFDQDELAAYAARLMMLHRWHRFSKGAEPPSRQAQRNTQ